MLLSKGTTLRTRIMLIVLSIYTLGAAIIFVKITNHELKNLRDSYRNTIEMAASKSSEQLQTHITELHRNTIFLARTPPLLAFTQTANKGASNHRDSNLVWKSRLQQIFKGFLETHPHYFQLRYIGIADHGKELVRVVREDNRITVVSDTRLQSKGGRDYFQKTLQLSENESYISEITLNSEHGEVQKPYIQTIRASQPVFSPDGKMHGMVVANMDIGVHLPEIMKSDRPGINGYITNMDGDYLFHPDSTKTFGFDLGLRHRWQDEMPELTLQSIETSKPNKTPIEIKSELLTTDKGALNIAAANIHFDPNKPNRHLTVIYTFPEELIYEQTQSTRNMLAIGLLLLLLLIFIITYFTLRKLFSPLNQLTACANEITNGQHNIPLPSETSGELASFVEAFRNMLKGIKEKEIEVASLYQNLKKSEAYANHIIETAPQGIIVVDAIGAIVRVNQVALSMFGYSLIDLLGKPVELLIPEEKTAQHHKLRTDYQQSETYEKKKMGKDRLLMAQRKDGSKFYVEIGLSPLHLDDKHHIVATISDITERTSSEQELQIAATVFDSHEAMMVTDADANILRVNDAFIKVTGYSRDEVIGKNPRLLQSGRHSIDFYEDMWQQIIQSGGWQGEIWDRRKNGEIYPKWSTISSVKDHNGKISNYISIFTDITAVKAAQDEVLKLAYYDPLTGLANRRRLIEQLEQHMLESERSKTFCGLLFIDLDNFKVINDTLGHDQGDLLLKEVAQRLQTNLREVDFVARLGGDEFVVILYALGKLEKRALENAAHIGEKLVQVMAEPYLLAGDNHLCTGSVGVTLFHGTEVSVDEVFRNSDVAMYEAKRSGRNGLRFFDPAMQAAIESRSKLELAMRTALKEDQFVLFFQKQVNANGEVIGAESLIRWIHPQRGMIPPFEFIPVCEESGLIIPVGHWVLEEACRKLKQWQSHPKMKHLTISVNSSVKEFMQEGYVDLVLKTIQKAGISPAGLELEITESMGHSNLDELTENLLVLRKAGINIAMDDFGTGYSSLSYLKRLPLNTIKIDQSFVRDLGVDASDESIVQTIIKIGETFGMDVIAEGVETEEQLQLLREYGCPRFQGYFFGRPVPAEEFEEEFKP